VIKTRTKAPVLLAGLLVLLSGYFGFILKGEPRSSVLSKTAANACAEKIRKIKNFAQENKKGKKQELSFTEREVNSWLALDYKSHYHPCLQDMTVRLEGNIMEATIAVNFDHLPKSTGFMSKVLGFMFSGVHSITARGQFLRENETSRFSLEKALFDDITLPNYLVNDILSSVGLSQNPPIDPANLSTLPHGINRIDIRNSRIITYQ